MKGLLAEWVGKTVHVTLRASMPTPIQGQLLAADATGILVQMPKGRTFIPATSILHVSLLDEA